MLVSWILTKGRSCKRQIRVNIDARSFGFTFDEVPNRFCRTRDYDCLHNEKRDAWENKGRDYGFLKVAGRGGYNG